MNFVKNIQVVAPRACRVFFVVAVIGSTFFSNFSAQAQAPAPKDAFGCVSGINGNYVCFPTLQGCQNICVPPNGPCTGLYQSQCGKPPLSCGAAGQPCCPGNSCFGGLACVNNNCQGSQTVPGPAPMGNLIFKVNLRPPSRYTNLAQFIDAISGYLLVIAIPLAVILIIYAGIKMLLARGNPGEVQKAKDILWYVLIGLAIIVIGRGFISLITSIVGTPKVS